MVKTIIFDWGGVLIENPAHGIVSYCASHLGTDEKTLITARNKLFTEFQKGAISEDVFWTEVCNELRLQKPRTSSLWADAFRHAYSPIEEMFNFAHSLKDITYNVCILSNTEYPALNHLNEPRYAPFNPIITSCIEGFIKPEQKIYEIALEKTKTIPEETLFIDDKIENLNGAEKLGISTFLFNGREQINDLATFIMTG